MKTKLWVMWGVLSATTILVGVVSGSFPLTLCFAVAAAGAGWAAFLVPRNR